jgi:hypothetical protein
VVEDLYRAIDHQEEEDTFLLFLCQIDMSVGLGWLLCASGMVLGCGAGCYGLSGEPFFLSFFYFLFLCLILI